MEIIYYLDKDGRPCVTSSDLRLDIEKIAGNYYVVSCIKLGEKVNTKTLIQGRKNLIDLILSLKLDEHFITFNIGNYEKSQILKQLL